MANTTRATKKVTPSTDDVHNQKVETVAIGEDAKQALRFLDEWITQYTKKCFEEFCTAEASKLPILQSRLVAAEHFKSTAAMAIRSGNRAASQLS